MKEMTTGNGGVHGVVWRGNRRRMTMPQVLIVNNQRTVGMWRDLFSDAKRAEDSAEYILRIDPTDDVAHCFQSGAQFLRHELR